MRTLFMISVLVLNIGCASVEFVDAPGTVKNSVYYYERVPLLIVGHNIDQAKGICSNTFSTVTVQGRRKAAKLKSGLIGNATLDVSISPNGFIGGVDASTQGALNSLVDIASDVGLFKAELLDPPSPDAAETLSLIHI